jgi:predicted DNA-binding protein
MKRTQIYLDEEQDKVLTRRAREKGTTKSNLIREAVTEYIASTSEEDEKAAVEALKVAVRSLADHPITSLPDGLTYVRRLRKADRRRWKELQRRWRE